MIVRFDVPKAREPIWKPPANTFSQSQLAEFVKYCAPKTGRSFVSSAIFHEFSVREFRQFWRLFLDWSKIPYGGDAATVCRGTAIEHAEYFPDVILNYAEVLLDGMPDLPAIAGLRRDQPPYRLKRSELRSRVAAAAMGLQDLGIRQDSRIAICAQNDAEAVVGVLAAAALGATIATISPDFGAFGALERLSQVHPTHLLAQLGQECSPRLQLDELITALVDGLPTLRSVVLLDDGTPPACLTIPVVRMEDLRAGKNADAFVWPRLSFNHPLFIMFTSGTTGPPKCIVHGAGGTLIEHVKEHRLHCDLRPGDKLFFHTSTAWMMWHWQLSALASGAEIVLNPEPVTGPETLWQIVADQAVTVFGTSPSYLQLCDALEYDPSGYLDFSKLRAVLSTGSTLFNRQQDWVTRHVRDLPVQSISGGSDIMGCFVLGNPMAPAYRAECTSRSLGLDVQAFATDVAGLPLGAGELICANPFPSRPLGLLNDPDGVRFHDAYFAKNPGVWTHGDLIVFTPEGTARLLGRSDGVMNIRGIRIGTAEIYRAIADIREVQAALSIAQIVDNIPGNARIVLIVKLADGVQPEQSLFDRISFTIKRRTSPAHMPAIIIDVPELPMTLTGKLSERSAYDAVNGLSVANSAALRNPECLSVIANHPALHRSRALKHDPTIVLQKNGLATSLQEIWETVLNRRPIDPNEDFFDLSGDSLSAIVLLRRVKQILNVDLPITSIYEASSIAAMTAMIESGVQPSFRPLIRLKDGDEGSALFLIPGLGGNAMNLVGLVRQIQYSGAIYGLQARGLSSDGQPHDTVEELARDGVSAIRNINPCGPYCLAGYSFGGLVAFEMARRLRSEGELINVLCLIDSTLAERYWSLQTWVAVLFKRLRMDFATLTKMRTSDAFYYGIDRTIALIRAPMRRFFGAQPFDAPPDDLPQSMRAVRDAQNKAFSRYRPGYYDGTITLIRCDRRRTCDPQDNWIGCSTRLIVRDVSGDHLGLIRNPTVDIVAREISTALASQNPKRRRQLSAVRVSSKSSST